MALYTWYNGNRGFGNYCNLEDFAITTITGTTYGGTLDTSVTPYDPDDHAWRFEATVLNGELTTVENGPEAGKAAYTAGTVTSISFYDQSNNLIMKISGLSLDAAALHTVIVTGEFSWQYVARGTNTFIGSNDSHGSTFNGDLMLTSHGRDTVRALGGDDEIGDVGGADKYNGGSGFDLVRYDPWLHHAGLVKTGIVANLALGTVKGPDGFTDTLTSIEGLSGTFLKDRMTGNALNNVFFGLQGNDTIDGAGGWDSIVFNQDAGQGGYNGVSVNLQTGVAIDGFGTRDTLRGIEAAVGTKFDDVLQDNGKRNVLVGNDGDDVIRLSGGSDQVAGGAGADDFQFAAGFGSDLIRDFSQTDGDIITITGPAGMQDLSIIQSGSNTIIDYLGDTITLQNFVALNLTASDFVFV